MIGGSRTFAHLECANVRDDTVGGVTIDRRRDRPWAQEVDDDDPSEMRRAESSLRQRVLEAFRLCSEHASAIRDDLREQWAEPMIETYGEPKAAADAIWVLARDLGWCRGGDGAERYLLRRGVAAPPPNPAVLDLVAGWRQVAVGRLSHDGHDRRGHRPTA
jgi:serine/threonine-protein kinase HipA